MDPAQKIHLQKLVCPLLLKNARGSLFENIVVILTWSNSDAHIEPNFLCTEYRPTNKINGNPAAVAGYIDWCLR